MTREEKQKAIDALKISAPVMAVTQEEFNDYIRTLNKVMDWLEQEPTTKNDLGVDCISRDEVCRYVAEFVNHEFSTREEEELIDNIITGIERMPSVTPKIKPRKGEWLRMSDLSEQEDDRYKCSRCGNVIHHKNKMDLYTFNSWCGRCGSDNGRHINYEVEE